MASAYLGFLDAVVAELVLAFKVDFVLALVGAAFSVVMVTVVVCVRDGWFGVWLQERRREPSARRHSQSKSLKQKPMETFNRYSLIAWNTSKEEHASVRYFGVFSL